MFVRDGLEVLPILAGFALFVIQGLPMLPKVSDLRAPSEPPGFMFASAWYCLPKSADILFRQTLAAGQVLTATRAGIGIVAIALGVASAFGGFHLPMVFDGFTPIHVARFTLSATLTYFILRHRLGPDLATGYQGTKPKALKGNSGYIGREKCVPPS